MTNLNFAELYKLFGKNNFPSIENDERGIRFLKLISMSRKATMIEFCKLNNLEIENFKRGVYLPNSLELQNLSDEAINDFINKKYQEERILRSDEQEYLIDQLCRLDHFDWGGSFNNSLEKNIVDNYVKRYKSYDKINEEIEGSLLLSLKGYTLNSWYNHWTSILIEDIFKDHPIVLPTIGKVKKIDFFINDVPFDLKVTYFPEGLIKTKLKDLGYGSELTRLKQVCRLLEIYIPKNLKDKDLQLHLYKKVSEDQRPQAKDFIKELIGHKTDIISEAKMNPAELKKWFYVNQGPARFDASNRFFLVLTDEDDMTNSWKLKRNIVFLKEKITEHLDDLKMNMESLETEFYWKLDQKTYHCKSDILFLKYEK